MAVPLCDFSSVHTLSSLPSRKDIDIYKMKYVTIKTNSTSDSVLSGEGGGGFDCFLHPMDTLQVYTEVLTF